MKFLQLVLSAATGLTAVILSYFTTAEVVESIGHLDLSGASWKEYAVIGVLAFIAWINRHTEVGLPSEERTE